MVAALFASPSVLSATVEGRRCLNAASKYGQEYMRTIWTAQLLVFCAMPVGIILTLYTKTALFLKRSAENLPAERLDVRRVRHRKKLAGMIVAITVVFFVSYAPNFVVRVLVAWSVIGHDSSFTLYASFVSYCLFFSSTCFNPFTLYFISSKFKHLFKRYLFFWLETKTIPHGKNKFERLR